VTSVTRRDRDYTDWATAHRPGKRGTLSITEPEGPTDISALSWILIVAGGWVCLAAVVGLVVGRVIRNRDRQVPADPRPGDVEQNAPQQSRREPRR
jgi:hypothetical protein